ncbi:hypothetical protein OC846_002673 [Tilletia horrida]|uniref:FMR1-interacting protein 1 conserved domain-containing protein n=1 Tax=Tilletia horrida TaxID=155126 RepID=A0AAN6GTP7_9BASI|nr:hypothetical protein OC845_002397 [Tilletia horrida]KAK0553057.1 hypothetical protein OC846_002673 [Tilletia horrida]KAK0569705.1 hypothetical protein OC861_000667 [Tilletia horrida]
MPITHTLEEEEEEEEAAEDEEEGNPTQRRDDGFGQRRPPAPYQNNEAAVHPSSYPSSSRTKTDGPPDATIQGLNIRLDHPLLVEHWIAERKKRWPTKAVIEQKEKDAVWRLPGSLSVEAMLRRKRKREQDEEAEQRAKRANQAAAGSDSEDTDNDSDSSDDSDSSSSSSDSSSDEGDGPQDEGEADEADEEAETEAYQAEEKEQETTEHPRPSIQPGPAQPTPVEDASNQDSNPTSQPNPSSTPRFVPQEKKFRPRPRGPPTNPFARSSSDLLHALLRREIASHTDAVLQFFRFIVLNSFLIGVERKRGDAEEALRRANLIVETRPSSGRDADDDGGGDDDDDATRKVKAVSVDLKPLVSLSYPPAPDPLIFLDPLRALEPYPLSHEQLVAFCEDEAIREILDKCTLSTTEQIQPGPSTRAARESGLTTAIRTLDALPTAPHRTAALELILHIVDDPHQATATSTATQRYTSAAGAIWHPPASMNNNRQKPISETELFRLGLRVGPEQLEDVRMLAERVSSILEKVPIYSALPENLKQVAGLGKEGDGSADATASARASKMGAGVYEARGIGWQQLEWEREWERRETLRRLGIRLD